MNKYLNVYDEDGNELLVPARFEVCPQCEGMGTTSDHIGVFFPDDEYLQDEDFRDAYFDGRFDRPCPECSGSRVVLVADEGKATPHELACVERERRAEADARAIEAAERRMGC